MASITKDTTVNRPATACWDAIKAFDAPHDRLVKGFVVDTKMVDDRDREVTFFTGAIARERLVGRDDTLMRLAYTVVDSPMGSTHHNASVQVVPLDDEHCQLIWTTDVLPDELATRTAGLMESGITAMKATLEST